MNRIPLPVDVNNEVNFLIGSLPGRVHHYGVFGSIARGRPFSSASDVDILIIYSGTDFPSICESIGSLSLSIPAYASYLNYNRIDAKKPSRGKYFDLLFMPRDFPNVPFMKQHHESILYWGSPFETWHHNPDPRIGVNRSNTKFHPPGSEHLNIQ